MTKAEVQSVADAGEAIHQFLLPQLLPVHKGKYIIINVDTGEYEIDAEYLNASDRAGARWPGARRYAAKIGQDAICRIGSTASAKR